ncbi:hypothetical protein N7461_002955 [Penicillium sp. DV-2018c]|nr:hypothetical protein N7461_002955 [Penicillium sp. DV-2018c]
MDTVDDNGYTVRIDIGLLGAVMYEVVTGNKCKIDLYKDNSPTDGRAYWPDRKFLPSTEDIWLGWIIEVCWDGEIRDAHSLLRALDSVDVRLPDTTHFLTSIEKSMKERPITTIIGALGLGMLALFVGRRRF